MKREDFLSAKEEIHQAFMFSVANFQSELVIGAGLVGIYTPPTALAQPLVPTNGNGQTTEVQTNLAVAEMKQRNYVFIAGLAAMFLLFGALLFHAIEGSMFSYGLGFVVFLMVAPKLIEELGKRLKLAEKKEAEPQTFEAWVARKLGMETWKDGKQWKRGIMADYDMVYDLSPYLEIPEEVRAQYADPNNPSMLEGLRSYYRKEFRATFPAVIAQVRNIVMKALVERMSDLENKIEASGRPAMQRMAPQIQA